MRNLGLSKRSAGLVPDDASEIRILKDSLEKKKSKLSDLGSGNETEKCEACHKMVHPDALTPTGCLKCDIEHIEKRIKSLEAQKMR